MPKEYLLQVIVEPPSTCPVIILLFVRLAIEVNPVPPKAAPNSPSKLATPEANLSTPVLLAILSPNPPLLFGITGNCASFNERVPEATLLNPALILNSSAGLKAVVPSKTLPTILLLASIAAVSYTHLTLPTSVIV